VIRRNFAVLFFVASIFSISALGQTQNAPSPAGIFESQNDVGSVTPAGTGDYDAATKTYHLAASGQNIWALHDDFHFVWKRVSGDFAVTADISFPDKSGPEHKKAVLMFRESLDPDSKYADVAVHGNGLTALQYRHEKGAVTGELQLVGTAPQRLRLEKRGSYVYVFAADAAGEFHPSGAAVRVSFDGPFYVGIGMCAHQADLTEKGTFANVELTPLPNASSQSQLYSALDVIDMASLDISEVYVAPGRIEAPNWTHDGSAFIFNGEGHIWRLPVTGGKPETVNTGSAVQNINDHGISPDGTQLAITDQSEPDHHFRIYVLPVAGGTPRQVSEANSYWHGWSPDGKTLSFVGQRNSDYDVYTVPVAGGSETRLTTAKGIDDGPDYSPDGKYIYFSSERNGSMQIWRMNADGSDQQQITNDGFQNRFPHASPDGQSLEFLTYDPGSSGHPQDKDVMIRIMSLKDGSIKEIAWIFGGEGSINAPAWSPDGKKLAFVNYTYFPVEK
jgi:Tol biopolymer transport system component